MCGRTACTLAPDEFLKACRYKGKDGKIQEPAWRDGGGKYYPSYNISPQSFTPVLLSSQHFNNPSSEDTSERVLQPMRWGLIPSWHRGDPKEFSYNMSNARSDTLLDKRSFKLPLEKGKRCVVLAEGFFEWETLKGGKKQPYYIYFKKDSKVKIKEENTSSHEDEKFQGKDPLSCKTDVKNTNLKDEFVALGKVKEEDAVHHGDKHLLTMAGLFDCWQAPKGSANEGDELFSYTIITVDAAPSLKWLHNRMPAILHGEKEVCQWLDCGAVPWKEALNLVTPKDCLEWHPVSMIVNNSRNKLPECIKPIDLTQKTEKPVAGTLLSYFKRSPKKGEKMSSKKEELSEEPSPKKTKLQ